MVLAAFVFWFFVRQTMKGKLSMGRKDFPGGF